MHSSRPAPTGEKFASLARKAIEPYEPSSSIAALYAACCSPATIGQLPVWSLLLAQALAGHARGEHPATPQALRRWSRRVRRVVPAVGAYDADGILDPGLGVHVAWERALWPMHPGLSLCPEDVLDRVRRYAAAADSVLVPALGFGIADVITLGLQIMAAQHNSVSDLWPTPAVSRLQPARISPAEIQAMHTLLQECESLTEPPGVPGWLREHCSDDQLARTSAAARWCTVDADRISDGRWLLGGALFVQTDVAVLPVPAGLALDGIEAAGSRTRHAAFPPRWSARSTAPAVRPPGCCPRPDGG